MKSAIKIESNDKEAIQNELANLTSLLQKVNFLEQLAYEDANKAIETLQNSLSYTNYINKLYNEKSQIYIKEQ